MARPRTRALIITGYDDLLESLRLSVVGLQESGMLETQMVSVQVMDEIKELLKSYAQGEDPWKR